MRGAVDQFPHLPFKIWRRTEAVSDTAVISCRARPILWGTTTQYQYCTIPPFVAVYSYHEPELELPGKHGIPRYDITRDVLLERVVPVQTDYLNGTEYELSNLQDRYYRVESRTQIGEIIKDAKRQKLAQKDVVVFRSEWEERREFRLSDVLIQLERLGYRHVHLCFPLGTEAPHPHPEHCQDHAHRHRF